MPTRTRVFIPVGVKEYARVWGVSERTARRRVSGIAGAVKTDKGWRAPILATEYAKKSGKSVSSVRKSGLRAAVPGDLKDIIAEKNLSNAHGKRLAAASRLKQFARGRRVTPATVDKRIKFATNTQIARIGKMTQAEWEALISDPSERDGSDWQGSDGNSILYYH